MNDTHHLSKGDLGIMQNAGYYTEYNGALAVVVDDLAQREGLDMNTMEWQSIYCYEIKILVDPPLLAYCLPHQIRPLEETPADATRQHSETKA